MWKKLNPAPIANGTMVNGDIEVPRTKNWAHKLWLMWFVWKTEVVFQRVDSSPDEGIRIGFKDFRGNTWLRTTPIYDFDFKMLIGHEVCRFFALDDQNNEVRLEVVARADKSDPKWTHLVRY